MSSHVITLAKPVHLHASLNWRTIPKNISAVWEVSLRKGSEP